jgi:hypothetical protein
MKAHALNLLTLPIHLGLLIVSIVESDIFHVAAHSILLISTCGFTGRTIVRREHCNLEPVTG